MEPVGIDTPRGPATPVATLQLTPREVEASLGVTFAEVRNDLEPATLALARIDSGTLIGFANYPNSAPEVVHVVQFGDRRPRDVLVELMFDTGITHDTVMWTALGPREDDRMWARSLSEAVLYILVNAPSAHSDDEVIDAIGQSLAGDHGVLRHDGIELWVPGDVRLDYRTYSRPDDPPSTILDAGTWVTIAHTASARAGTLLAEHQAPYPYQVFVDVLKSLQRIAAAAGEALKFIPPGADTPPVTTCWTATGLDVYRNHREHLDRAYLERVAADGRKAAEDWEREIGPRTQD
ncbi:hypothetical protein [Dactylosporangium sp. CS-033363]|uniref:hypothetical protein n=1 Tax=Dactylosporangium sp. CS-033363 TaxID=3239935 RepID=UPI003D8D2B7D